MKTIRWFCLVAFLLAGCGRKIVNHQKPDLKVDFSQFTNAGCPLDEYGYNRICEKNSALYALGCDRIDEVPDLMGGLMPAYPMAVCNYMPYYRTDVANPFDVPQSEYFFNVGGPMPSERQLDFDEVDNRQTTLAAATKRRRFRRQDSPKPTPTLRWPVPSSPRR